MTEAAKTLTFVGVAIVVLGIALLTRPAPPRQTLKELAGRKPLNQVDDPLIATQLEIVKYDEDQAERDRFEVAKVDGVWSIPSHHNYPADAEKQLGEAAVATMNLKVLDVVSDNAGDHPTYGVVNPDDADATSTGVGMRVTMKDEGEDALVNMIIGKQVEGEEDQHYVREVDKDTVYIVKVDTSKLSTNFEDWIEKDLLKLNPFDVTSVLLRDYSIEQREREVIPGLVRLVPVEVPRSRIDLDLVEDDSGSDQWQVSELKSFDREAGEFVAVEVPEDEELDQVKLNDLKSALDDLKIVDVERKPEGIGADLSGAYEIEEFQKPEVQQLFATAQKSLQQRGFYMVPFRKSEDEVQVEILSSEGEVICQMKDGVEYILRFGEIALGDGPREKAPEQTEGEEEKEAEAGVNRYIFVAARFNQDLIPPPELEPLPGEEEPQGSEAEGEKKPAEGEKQPDGAEAKKQSEPEGKTPKEADAAAPSEKSGEEVSGVAASDEGATSDGGPASDEPDASKAKPDETSGQSRDASDESTAATGEESGEKDNASETSPAEKASSKEEAAEKAEEESAENGSAKKPTEKEPAGDDAEKPDAAEKDPAAKPAEKQPTEEELAAQRAEIEKQNKRRQERYEEKIKEGNERVEELNNRFAAWYYVISDEVYQKIHLTREDIFKKKEEDEAEKEKPGGLKFPGAKIPGLPGNIQDLIPEGKKEKPAPGETKKKEPAEQETGEEEKEPEAAKAPGESAAEKPAVKESSKEGAAKTKE